MTEPRGIRNNNPGNIRHGDNWQGMAETQTDPSFIQFIAPEWGIRALVKIIKNYQSRYGINTVSGVISRWAPPNENHTDSYISAVARKLGVDPEQTINVEDYLLQFAEAIIYQENGEQPYSLDIIEKGIALA